jgi:excisionase family DNA binding protein
MDASQMIHDAGWWSTGEIAALLGMPVRTIRYHVAQGWLKAEITGRTTAVRGSDLKAWLREGVARRDRG